MIPLRTSIRIGAAVILAAAVAAAIVGFINRPVWDIGGAGSLDYIVRLPGKYELWRCSSHNINICLDGTLVVPAEVTGIGIQGDFITVDQYIADRNHLPVEEDYRYWIIRVHDENVLGPFELAAFAAICKEFGIESSLKSRKPVSYYREQAEYADQEARGT
jgi:hypothetical protein